VGPVNAQGAFATNTNLLDALLKLMLTRGGPLTSSFPYDRNALLAKRDADLATGRPGCLSETIRLE